MHNPQGLGSLLDSALRGFQPPFSHAWSHKGWKRPLRSTGPTINPSAPRRQLSTTHNPSSSSQVASLQQQEQEGNTTGWRLEAERLKKKRGIHLYFYGEQGKEQLGRITGVGETVMQTGWGGSCWV